MQPLDHTMTVSCHHLATRLSTIRQVTQQSVHLAIGPFVHSSTVPWNHDAMLLSCHAIIVALAIMLCGSRTMRKLCQHSLFEWERKQKRVCALYLVSFVHPTPQSSPCCPPINIPYPYNKRYPENWDRTRYPPKFKNHPKLYPEKRDTTHIT